MFFLFTLVESGEGKSGESRNGVIMDQLCGGCSRGQLTIHRSFLFQGSDNTEGNSLFDDDSQI